MLLIGILGVQTMAHISSCRLYETSSIHSRVLGSGGAAVTKALSLNWLNPRSSRLNPVP